MPIAEILTLVELFTNFKRRKIDLNKEHFREFIEPVWAAFNKIHENYKQSFREYGEIVLKEDYPITDLINRIAEDSLFTEDLRSNLQNLIEFYPRSEIDEPARSFYEFIYCINEYFQIHKHILVHKNDLKEGANKQDEIAIFAYRVNAPNLPRYEAIIYLNRNDATTPSGRQDAKALFNMILHVLQNEYSKASRIYFSLKEFLFGQT